MKSEPVKGSVLKQRPTLPWARRLLHIVDVGGALQRASSGCSDVACAGPAEYLLVLSLQGGIADCVGQAPEHGWCYGA